jgi:pilus assembly protein TadC
MIVQALLAIIGFPNGVALDANIEVLHIFIVISHINDLGWLFIFFVIGVAPTIRAFHIINAREGRVEFRVLVNDMVECLSAFFQLRF